MALIPGFRFHPTDVELVMFYLKRKLLGKKIKVNAVAEVNIYDFSPWDLPDKSCLKSGDLEWYFFCPKAKKYSSGCRSNRSTETGFWKATGKDRMVKYTDRTVAAIKTLVFHIGHKGKGERTDWVMHEYIMEDERLANAGVVQDMYVLCKVFKKSGSGPKNGAQYGAPFNEEEWDDDDSQVVVDASSVMDNEQEGLATMNTTEQASSTTSTLNMDVAPSLTVTVPGSLDNEQEMNLTEQGSSIIIFSANPPPNMDVAQGLSVTDALFDMPASDDFMCIKDIDLIMGSKQDEAAAANMENVKSAISNQDDIYTNLVNLVDLEDLNEINFKTGEADYMLDDLEEFYVE